MNKLRKFFIGAALGVVVLALLLGGAVSDRFFSFKFIDNFLKRSSGISQIIQKSVVNEESVVIDVVEKVGPSVVTIGIKKTEKLVNPFDNFFDPFGFFGFAPQQPSERKIEQDIGSGFVVSKDGLIVTNKHVVADTSAQYRVFMKDDKLFEVEKIYRDPANDLAIIKINANDLKPVEMGDSSKLRVGQFVIAIGTALGEFRNTVTTGVVSGLGRGITAGSPFEGYVESLDNVIQTDAAINPGNSGGPLLNSQGQVIGISVAVASGAQNIGFALPISVVKDSLENFNKTGQFSRPFLGVRYRMISNKEAIAKGWVEGAGVVEVVLNSPAEKAGIKVGDIITKVDQEKVTEANDLLKILSKKKVGEEIKVVIWRENKEETLTVVLREAS